MASSEEVIPKLPDTLPDTLPDNFGEWDGDASQGSAHGDSDEWESVLNNSGPPRQKAHGEPENLDAMLSSIADRSRVWRSDSHAPAPAPVIDRPLNEYVNLEKGASPVASPRRSNEPAAKAAPAEASKPAEQPKENKTAKESKMVFSPALENPPEEWPAVSEPAFAGTQKPAAESTEAAAAPAAPQSETRNTLFAVTSAANSASAAQGKDARKSSEFTNSMAREADKALFEVFSTKNSSDEDEEESGAGNNKKLMIVGGVAAAVLVPVILIFVMGHHGAKAAVNPVDQPVSAATEAQPETTIVDQSAAETRTQQKPSATTKSTQAADKQTSDTETEADSSPAVSQSQVEAMKGQLNAPKIISGAMKSQVAENAPPPENIGMAGMAGLAGSAPAANAFSSGARPVVNAGKPVSISSGVATGMLIRKTPPVYPPIAKTARVEGTVELAATISKNGTIKDLRVVNGPAMLRQAALDAVRTWVYKPYELNHEPVDVETSISVVFSLRN
jgi:TonB family protein